eukprot:15479060-Alexandrium_andersonii.AAC.1
MRADERVTTLQTLCSTEGWVRIRGLQRLGRESPSTGRRSGNISQRRLRAPNLSHGNAHRKEG